MTTPDDMGQGLKHALKNRTPKTANNVLTVLNKLLKTAVEWEAIDRMPCAIRLLPLARSSAAFHDFDDFEKLIEGAKTDADAFLIVLLGGEAGLRCGEIMALEWSDVDLVKRQLRIERSIWKGHSTSTKGGRVRYVPLTVRLAAALQGHRHLKSDRVLCSSDGTALRQRLVQGLVARAARRANLRKVGVHIRRHTFCSHLAIRARQSSGHRERNSTAGFARLSDASGRQRASASA